jgi:glycosyltransferase involved in cell wall biosynthesis
MDRTPFRVADQEGGTLPGEEEAAVEEGPLRVLQVITPHKIAGAERSTTSLCEHLARAGHEVIVACRRDHPLIPVMREVGLDVRGLQIGGKFNLTAPLRLARLARQERVEIINTQLSTAALWGSIAGRLTGVPTVATVRALNDKSFYMLAGRVIAVSHAVRGYLVAQGMRADRIDVVYNGIDPGRYRLALTREAARDRLGLGREAIVFAVVGHFSTRKGHAVFLDAAARIADCSTAHLYLFAGEGQERQHLERQAKRLALAERVIFTGFLADILPVYAAADVVVLPSIAGEGLPRALLEAGFLGRPVIGTRLSGTPEFVEDGLTGLIVPPGDVPALADAMLRLGQDPPLRARMGAAAAERVCRLFTIPAMVEGTLATYERAIRGRQSLRVES